MSLGIGEGSELQVPLARVVIGGLTTSLLITLVLVPTGARDGAAGFDLVARRNGTSCACGRPAVRRARRRTRCRFWSPRSWATS